jgi:hypothetical protein
VDLWGRLPVDRAVEIQRGRRIIIAEGLWSADKRERGQGAKRWKLAGRGAQIPELAGARRRLRAIIGKEASAVEAVIGKQTIPLNLVYDYPVRWSKYKVLRDFVQNFYDSIDCREWSDRFRYSYISGELSMSVAGVCFSYEWLVPIGASTKRDGSKTYAGYFGEGFKIASLNALREYGWQVRAASSGWRINVVKSEMLVDNKRLDSLAYELEQCERSPDATLIIRDIHVPPALIESVMLSFFYPNNPLLGDRIWASSFGAIYKRSKRALPEYAIVTHEFGSAGIVFAAYQNLGSINLPLVFANHDFRKDDRDRGGLYDFDVISLIEKLVRHVDARASATLLDYFRSYWYSYPAKKYDLHSFHAIVSILIRNMANSGTAASEFRAKNPHLLVAARIPRKDIVGKNLRSQALGWMKRAEKKYRLVQKDFELLGYSRLEDECMRHGGYTLTRDANEHESKYVRLLELCTETIIGTSFFGYDKLPACSIIINESAAWRGMAICFSVSGSLKNGYGHRLRYRMDYIAIKANLLKAGGFASAYSTYMHELCHVFGGDSSPGFSRALSDIMEMQLSGIGAIKLFEEVWNEVGGAADGQKPEQGTATGLEPEQGSGDGDRQT